jgi:hypothetical protein
MEEEGAVVGEEAARAKEAALVREEGGANGREGRRVCVKERRQLAFKRIYTCGWFFSTAWYPRSALASILMSLLVGPSLVDALLSRARWPPPWQMVCHHGRLSLRWRILCRRYYWMLISLL